MAPSGPPAKKADADAKAAPKTTKPKAPKKEKEAEEPKMQQPDFDAHTELVGKVQEQIDKLQKENAAISAKINERSVGKEDFFAKKAVIRSELDVVSGEMNAIQEQRDQIKGMLGEKKTENAEMKAELGKMKKTMNFTNAADIDERIRTIESRMMHDVISLKEEKAYIVEIKELKKNKPKLAQLGQMQDKVSNLDAGTDLRAKNGELNEAMAILREKKKGVQERLAELTEARKAQMGDFSEVMEQREGNSKKIGELIAQRSTLRDEFNAAKREFQGYLAEQRRIKQDKYQEDRKAQQDEWKIRQLEKKIESLDEQPYVSELTLIEQTVKFCKDFLPKDASADVKEEKKDTVHNNKDGETVLLKKENRDEEFYWAPTKKAKAAKKGKSASADGAKKPIKHNAETFKLFDSLKLDAPITTADIPALLTKLAEQQEMYEKKVQEWADNKEDMKRKIKEGIITMEDLEKEEKGEEKEEEKEEKKEEEKEEEKKEEE